MADRGCFQILCEGESVFPHGPRFSPISFLHNQLRPICACMIVQKPTVTPTLVRLSFCCAALCSSQWIACTSVRSQLAGRRSRWPRYSTASATSATTARGQTRESNTLVISPETRSPRTFFFSSKNAFCKDSVGSDVGSDVNVGSDLRSLLCRKIFTSVVLYGERPFRGSDDDDSCLFDPRWALAYSFKSPSTLARCNT